VTGFYHDNGYGATVSPSDCVLMAEVENKIVGVVRICEESDTVVLRGMQVAPGFRTRGIGTALLGEVSELIGDRECYCLPYTHLQEFYSRIGFHTVGPERTPGFLKNRRDEYEAKGLDVVVMFRRSIGEVAV
jgi:N-acetylglutamate synthase-like GNAT family acetyltransferase